MQIAPRRLRWRLSLWYAVSLTLLFTVFASCVFLFVRMSCMGPIQAQMDKDFFLVEQAIHAGLGDVSRLEIDGIVPLFRITESATPDIATSFTTLYAARNWRLARIPGSVPVNSNGYWAVFQNGRHYFMRQSTLRQAGKILRIDIAEDAEQAYMSVKKLALALLLGIPLVLICSLGSGYVFAGHVLAPIGAMARKAREISADRLSERLPIQDASDEFGHLASVFNETFERLEESFERMRRFAADASHEMRTPLAIIRSVGENAVQQSLAPEQYENAIGSILEETDRLVQLLDGLLMLTRAEAGQLPLRSENVALIELAGEVVSCLRVLAEEKCQHLRCDGGAEIYARADRTMLRQALINLVANAIRYTPEQGEISVRVDRSTAGISVIEVRDNGPGIALAHQHKIFERFYRIDQDRSRETGGAGLGLAISRWLVELNGGSIELESAESAGSTFRIKLL